jgi:hypothetical protein
MAMSLSVMLRDLNFDLCVEVIQSYQSCWNRLQ